MLSLLRLGLVAVVFVVASCGEQKFEGTGASGPGKGTPKEAPVEKPSADAASTASEEPVAETPKVDASSVLTQPGDQQFLLECVKQWGSDAFTAEQLKGFRVHETTSLGIGRTQVVDSKATVEPRLVLVKFRSNGLSGVEMQLLNPNGYYCIHGETLGFASTKITKHCQAEIASDTRQSNGIADSSVELVGCDHQQEAANLTGIDSPAWVNATY